MFSYLLPNKSAMKARGRGGGGKSRVLSIEVGKQGEALTTVHSHPQATTPHKHYNSDGVEARGQGIISRERAARISESQTLSWDGWSGEQHPSREGGTREGEGELDIIGNMPPAPSLSFSPSPTTAHTWSLLIPPPPSITPPRLSSFHHSPLSPLGV